MRVSGGCGERLNDPAAVGGDGDRHSQGVRRQKGFNEFRPLHEAGRFGGEVLLNTEVEYL